MSGAGPDRPLDPQPRDLLLDQPLTLVRDDISWAEGGEAIWRSFELVEEDGEVLLILTFDWTNLSEDTEKFWTALRTLTFQQGLQLQPAYFSDYVDYEKSDAEVEPGESMTGVPLAYYLRDRSDLLIELTDWSNVNPHYAVIRVSELEGLPEDFAPIDPDAPPFPTLPIDSSEPAGTAASEATEPSETEPAATEPAATEPAGSEADWSELVAGLPVGPVISLGENEITFTDIRRIVTYDGEPALRIDLDWHNSIAGDIVNATTMFRVTARQNGQELDDIPWSDAISQEPATVALLPNAMLSGLQYGFVLLDETSPVDLEFALRSEEECLFLTLQPAQAEEADEAPQWHTMMDAETDCFAGREPFAIGTTLDVAPLAFTLRGTGIQTGEGEDAARVVVLRFDVENRGDTATSAWLELDLYLMQNGGSLPWIELGMPDEDPELLRLIEPGETLEGVEIGFQLRSVADPVFLVSNGAVDIPFHLPLSLTDLEEIKGDDTDRAPVEVAGLRLHDPVRLGGQLVTFRSITRVPNHDGTTSLKLVMDWQSGNRDIRTADDTFDISATQNGQILDDIPQSDYIDHEPSIRALLPGTSLCGLQYAFVLHDESSPVELGIDWAPGSDAAAG